MRPFDEIKDALDAVEDPLGNNTGGDDKDAVKGCLEGNLVGDEIKIGIDAADEVVRDEADEVDGDAVDETAGDAICKVVNDPVGDFEAFELDAHLGGDEEMLE